MFNVNREKNILKRKKCFKNCFNNMILIKLIFSISNIKEFLNNCFISFLNGVLEV